MRKEIKNEQFRHLKTLENVVESVLTHIYYMINAYHLKENVSSANQILNSTPLFFFRASNGNSENPFKTFNSEAPEFEKINEESIVFAKANEVTGAFHYKNTPQYHSVFPNVHCLLLDFIMVTNPLHIVKKPNKISGCQMSSPSPEPFSFGLNTTQQNSKSFNTSNRTKRVSSSNTREKNQNTSLCLSFNEIYGLNLTHWEGGTSSPWVIKNNISPPQLLYSGPVTKDTNSLLIAKYDACFPGSYQAKIRLIDESEAGIAFRIPIVSKDTFYSVTLTSQGVLQSYSSFIVLRQILKGKNTILTKRKSKLVGIDKTNLLTVIDFHQNNSITILLNQKPIFSYLLPTPAPTSSRIGLYLVSGSAAISNILFSNF